MKLLRDFLIFSIVVYAVSQDNCPDSSSILPCKCYLDNEDRPFLKCESITSEDELEAIFSAYFPVPEVVSFYLDYSPLSEISRNVFSNISFNTVSMTRTDIQYISEDAFENSIEAFWQIILDGCPLTEDSFPLNLQVCPYLNDFRLANNQLSEFPSITSTNLQYLYITNNKKITVLPTGVLRKVPRVNYLDISGNGIDTIEDGALQEVETLVQLIFNSNNLHSLYPSLFRNLSSLTYLPMEFNEIYYIEPDTFRELPSLQFMSLYGNNLDTLYVSTFGEIPSLQTLDLIANGIHFIQPGTFSGTTNLLNLFLSSNILATLYNGTFDGLKYATVHLDSNRINEIESDAFGDLLGQFINLRYNNLTELNESWMRPLLERNNSVHLEGNPLTCGCDIAWIIEDNKYQSGVYAECSNGTSFSDLDPDYYINNC